MQGQCIHVYAFLCQSSTHTGGSDCPIAAGTSCLPWTSPSGTIKPGLALTEWQERERETTQTMSPLYFFTLDRSQLPSHLKRLIWLLGTNYCFSAKMNWEGANPKARGWHRKNAERKYTQRLTVVISGRCGKWPCFHGLEIFNSFPLNNHRIHSNVRVRNLEDNK